MHLGVTYRKYTGLEGADVVYNVWIIALVSLEQCIQRLLVPSDFTAELEPSINREIRRS